jgi:hypothetical protein
MRLLSAVALVLSMSSTDIERAQTLARARESERQQFHHRYVIDLPGSTVTQIEVTTEFRRLVMIAEEHVLRGDWMFTRSVRAGQEAIAPMRGLITIRAQVRFNPLNTFVQAPPYLLGLGSGAANAPVDALATQVTPQFSVPFKTADKKTLSSLIGATLEATIAAGRVGQSALTVAVMLDGKETARTTVDFARLD